MSINTGNNYNIDVLRKLGLSSDIPQISNSESPFIPFNLYSIPTHKQIEKYQLSIQNDGTLKDYIPFFSLKKLNEVYSVNGIQISEHDNYKINFQPNGFYTQIVSKIPILGQINHNFSPKHNERLVDNDYFNKFEIKVDKLTQNILHRGINNNLGFSRIAFPSGATNNNTLSGFYYKKNSGTYIPTIIKSAAPIGNISGSLFKSVNGSFRSWKSSDTQGYDAKNYSSFYLGYPTTIDQTTYNGFNIATKIAPALADFPINNETGVKLNGLMIISTGNGVNSKICYISPHGLKTGLMNTFVYSLNKYSGQLYTKGVSGVVYRGLTIGSEYYTGSNQFPTSGIRYLKSGDQSVTGAVGYTGETSGFWRLYNIDANEHLKQNTAINSTLFYKFYSGLYTGNKTFNTGTWNGIIPTGTVFQIEYVTTEFNKEIGCNHPFYILYSGYGTLDQIDSKLTKFLTSTNVTGITSTGQQDPNYIFDSTYRFYNPSKFYYSSNHPSYLQDDQTFSKVGRGVGNNRNLSLTNAFLNLKYQYFICYSWLLKTFAPEIIKQNRKFRRMQKFIAQQNNT